MRFFSRVFKNRFIRIGLLSLTALVMVAMPLQMALSPNRVEAQFPYLDPDKVREAVLAIGLDSLANVVLTEPQGLNIFARVTAPVADITTNPPTPPPSPELVAWATANGYTVEKAARIILGKAFFWDQQIGSDGQACASCHFVAGTDNRVVNSLGPGSRGNPFLAPEGDQYNMTRSGAMGGPNYTLTAADYPFHELADPLETDYMKRDVLFDTDDITASMGAFHATYTGSPAPDYAQPFARGTYDAKTDIVDPLFNDGVRNTRSIGSRQAATTINAVFSFRNFWDGRADNNFNGLNGFGTRDLNSFIYWNAGGSLIWDLVGGTNDSSLASQAQFPPNSETSDEMAFSGRTMKDIGRKIFRLTATPETPAATIIPLGAQQVSPTDSVLGPFVNPPGVNGGRGISLSYQDLVQWGFLPSFWNSAGPSVGGIPTVLLTPTGFHLMEENFPVFWGIAIQEYETLLIADQTPFDRFMEGDDTALTQDQLRGLLTYIHTEEAGQQVNPIFNNINFGACQLCHSGPELTENSLVNVPAKGFMTLDMTVKMDHNRELAIVPPASNFDVGFSNVGSRPFYEDLGIGGELLPGVPLSFTRGAHIKHLGLVLAGIIPGNPAFLSKPNPWRGTNIDGDFKIAHLRNIEMTGPYFHNGGSITLKQAVEFYARHGDFADINEPEIDVGLGMVQNIEHTDADMMVNFLLSLTDERVRMEQAPFDHPELFIPNGHIDADHPVLGPGYADENILTLPAVGAAGRSDLPAGPWPAGSDPIPNFMGVASTPVAGPNNDHFDS